VDIGREELKNKLLNGIAVLEFTKSDGSDRKMCCTLLESEIPQEKKPKNIGKRENLEILSVFDLEKQDWRSFKLDSLKSVLFFE
jgi:hypothetical protein